MANLKDALAAHSALRAEVLDLVKQVEARNDALEGQARAALEGVEDQRSRIRELRTWVDRLDGEISGMTLSRQERDRVAITVMSAVKRFAESANELPALLHSDLAGVLGSVQDRFAKAVQGPSPDEPNLPSQTNPEVSSGVKKLS